MNSYILRHIRAIEMIGVLLRIACFSAVSWLGWASPWSLVWSLNTVAASALLWCAILRRDPGYSVLNFFWILVGVVGILRASALSRNLHVTITH